MIRAPLLVGLVLLTAVTAMSWFLMKTSKDKFSDESTYPVYADFVDASGIRWKTRVQINGLDVGKIGGIEHLRLDNGRLVARVTVRILNDYKVYQDAAIKKAAESLLGDFRLDLDPGNREAGVLAPQGVIRRVQSVSDMDAIQSELKYVASNVKDITESFRRVLSGPEAEGSIEAIFKRVENSLAALETTTRVVAGSMQRNDENIDGILNDVRSFTGNLASTTGNQGDITKITSNLASLSSRLDLLAARMSEAIYGEAGSEASDSPLRQSIDNLTESVAHLNNIARKVDDGTGTMGRIINDPSISEKVEETLDSTNELFGGLSRLETQVELRSEFDVPFQPGGDQAGTGIKNIVGVAIKPRPDKSYILEAVADHRGRQNREVTRETVTVNGEESAEITETYTTNYNVMKFSAQFAKRYYFATLRFGIIENTGGLGLNLHALNDSLELRLDAFDFERRFLDTGDVRPPRLRGTFLYEFFDHLWLQAGIDDPFNADLAQWFLGGALRFTDEDLKTLMTVAPSP